MVRFLEIQGPNCCKILHAHQHFFVLIFVYYNHYIVHIPITPTKQSNTCLFEKTKTKEEGAPTPEKPTKVITTGMGRERELLECDGSRKRSQNYSRELRERLFGCLST